MRLALTAQLLEVKTKPDRTLILKFNTQEPSAQEAAELIKHNMEQVYLVILDEREIQNESI